MMITAGAQPRLPPQVAPPRLRQPQRPPARAAARAAPWAAASLAAAAGRAKPTRRRAEIIDVEVLEVTPEPKEVKPMESPEIKAGLEAVEAILKLVETSGVV